jgi:hypothetical protein
VLVERIAYARIKSQRIGHDGAEPSAAQIERACLVAEPVITVVGMARHCMQQIGPLPAEVIRAVRAVCSEQGAICVIPAQREGGQADLNRQLRALQLQPVVALDKLEPDWWRFLFPAETGERSRQQP